MKEIKDIIAAFKEAQVHGRKTALATVVHVEGSSYRRPGARMLVEENGKMTGAISGGCLEGDALRKALLAINQQENKLVTYNTFEEDDVEFGVQLGCNGIVHILFEPIITAKENNPIAILEKCFFKRKETVVVTLFSLKNFHGHQPGTCFYYDGQNQYSNVADRKLSQRLEMDAISVLSTRSSQLKQYVDLELTAFVELVQPAVSLIVVGAGNDTMPLVEMAAILGWETTVVDGRATHANAQRFSKAYQLIVGKPTEAYRQLVIDERTAIILMTHNYNYDLAMLEFLVQEQCGYIGVLGPKKKLDRMLASLEDKGISLTGDQRDRIYGPTGLDIGAETAEEIGLSVLAEIKAAFAKREGSSLRIRTEEIHTRSKIVVGETERDLKN